MDAEAAASRQARDTVKALWLAATAASAWLVRWCLAWTREEYSESRILFAPHGPKVAFLVL